MTQQHRGKIGIFGGSFDPIHFGHINLALQLTEIHGLKETWIIPTGITPFKKNLEASAIHRLKMAEIACKEIPRFSIGDREALSTQTSYTIDTIEWLAKKIKSPEKFCLLLGEDLVAEFPKWKQPHEIVKLADLLIGKRRDSTILLPNDPLLRQSIDMGITLTKVMEISSTEIRQRLKDRLYCGHLLPAKVLDYIRENQLYCYN